MSRIRINVMTGVAAVLFSASIAFAGDSPDDIKQRMGTGDPVAGQFKSALCQSCHGENGNSATSDYPKLAGQYAAYIQKQIHNFKDGSRNDPVMSGMAATVTEEQDLLDISAYFASQPQMRGEAPVDNPTGREKFMSANGCVSCHGVNGKGFAPNNPHAPVIGGQHKAYLVKQLKDFRSGTRNNESSGMMAMIAGFMSDEEIDEIASYVSGL